MITISREELLLRVQSFISVTLGRKVRVLLDKCDLQEDRLVEEGRLSLFFLAIIQFIEENEEPEIAAWKHAAVLIDWPNEWPVAAAFNEDSGYESCDPAPCQKRHRESFLLDVQTTSMVHGPTFNLIQFKTKNKIETYGVALWEGGSKTITVAFDPRPPEITAL